MGLDHAAPVPTVIHVGAVQRGAELVGATVGGTAVRVGRGELHL